MIQLPPGFNVTQLFVEFGQVGAPIVGVAVLIACFFVITKVGRRL